ncbi:MAG: hypothetical protein QM785_17880 [Pyrinomonadaceae bacterium]
MLGRRGADRHGPTAYRMIMELTAAPRYHQAVKPPIPPDMDETAQAEPSTVTVASNPPTANAPTPIRRVRTELNLEQWSIWLPAKSNRDPAPRVLTREIKGEDGSKTVAEVEITASRKGTLTTEDQRTYYALVEHHQRNDNNRDGVVYFSLRGIAKSLAKRWGSGAIDTITDSLTRLRANTIVWKNSYHDAATGRTQDELGFFNIITDLKIVTAKRDGHVTRAEGYFKLNDAIIANLEQSHTKPVLLDVVLKFRSEIAQILYTQLDRILSKDIAVYERKTKELFADLGLEGRKYLHPGGRKQQLLPAIAELEGAPLSNGFVIQSVSLERTADQKDYKIVVRRGRTRARNGTLEPVFSEGQAEPQPSKERAGEGRTEQNPAHAPPTGRPATADGEAFGMPDGNRDLEPNGKAEAKTDEKADSNAGADLLTYFYRAFFGAEAPTVQTSRKHRDLADWMVASHGEEMSRYIVDFAKAEAEKTRFRVATFGAIANYVDRAVAFHTLEQAELKRAAGGYP